LMVKPGSCAVWGLLTCHPGRRKHGDFRDAPVIRPEVTVQQITGPTWCQGIEVRIRISKWSDQSP
jgi:hypothetical protein